MGEVEEQGRVKKKKTLTNDGFKRVKDWLYAFYELNNTMPKDLKIPITRDFIVGPCNHCLWTFSNHAYFPIKLS